MRELLLDFATVGRTAARIIAVVVVLACTYLTLVVIATLICDSRSEEARPLETFFWIILPVPVPLLLGVLFGRRIPGSELLLISIGSIVAASGALLWWVGGVVWMPLGWIVLMLGCGKMARVRIWPGVRRAWLDQPDDGSLRAALISAPSTSPRGLTEEFWRWLNRPQPPRSLS
ncbi:MAG: hypothetical protein WEE64_09045 [Dehalococcoidia bacterium]